MKMSYDKVNLYCELLASDATVNKNFQLFPET